MHVGISVTVNSVTVNSVTVNSVTVNSVTVNSVTVNSVTVNSVTVGAVGESEGVGRGGESKSRSHVCSRGTSRIRRGGRGQDARELGRRE